VARTVPQQIIAYRIEKAGVEVVQSLRRFDREMFQEATRIPEWECAEGFLHAMLDYQRVLR
jgi:hypothetical protein